MADDSESICGNDDGGGLKFADEIKYGAVVCEGAIEPAGAFDEEHLAVSFPGGDGSQQILASEVGVFEFCGDVGCEWCQKSAGADE
jgi:hypothetical protein